MHNWRNFSALVYASYLFFQLFSHKALYQDDNEEIAESKRYNVNPFKIKKFRHGKQAAAPQYTETPLVGSPQQQIRFTALGDGTTHAAQPTSDPESGHVEEEPEEPSMSISVSIALLVSITVVSLLIICARDGKGDRQRSV